MKTNKYYTVTNDRDQKFAVIAENKEKAVEEYYRSLESTIGHSLKICKCFGDPKPIDRTIVPSIKSIVEGVFF